MTIPTYVTCKVCKRQFHPIQELVSPYTGICVECDVKRLTKQLEEDNADSNDNQNNKST